MRRRQAEKRIVPADPKFNNNVVAKFINIVMERGKKSLAEKVVYGAFERAAKETGESDVLKIMNRALDNARPRLEVKSRRVGGATYQIPVEVSQARGISIAIRWIRDFAKAKKSRPMVERLADEVVLAYKGEGSAIKKRDDSHKMAEANKAFAHFRW